MGLQGHTGPYLADGLQINDLAIINKGSGWRALHLISSHDSERTHLSC